MTDSAYVTVTEAAELLGISRVTLWRIIGAGVLQTEPNPLDRRSRLLARAAVQELRTRGVPAARRRQKEGTSDEDVRWAHAERSKEEENTMMKHGRIALQEYVVSGNFQRMTTHEIAQKLLEAVGEPVSRYRIALYDNVVPDGAPTVHEFAITHQILLRALEHLASLGGERLVVEGTWILFVPDL